MRKNLLTKAPLAAGLLLAMTAVTGCSSDSSDAASEASSAAPTMAASSSGPTPSTTAITSSGGWITLAEYEQDPAKYADTDVVLFFNASWCPTCQNTVKSLDAQKADFPAGLTVVSVDYDSETDLKKKYGVTTQHTFVQIDPAGDELQKWTGTETVDAIQAKV